MDLHELIAKEGTQVFVIENQAFSKSELRQQLDRSGIKLNAFAEQLFGAKDFDTSALAHRSTLLCCSLSDLGLKSGGNFAQINQLMAGLNLSPVPLALAAYIRLFLIDQPESMVISKGEHPHAAITIFSGVLDQDDDFPKGFYLRNFDGSLWLRGYCCSADYHWKPDVYMVFQIN